MNDSHNNLLLPERIAVTVKEAAELVGTNQKQIRRALYRRELQAAKIGKSYSIAVDDLKKWFNSKKRIL